MFVYVEFDIVDLAIQVMLNILDLLYHRLNLTPQPRLQLKDWIRWPQQRLTLPIQRRLLHLKNSNSLLHLIKQRYRCHRPLHMINPILQEKSQRAVLPR